MSETISPGLLVAGGTPTEVPTNEEMIAFRKIEDLEAQNKEEIMEEIMIILDKTMDAALRSIRRTLRYNSRLKIQNPAPVCWCSEAQRSIGMAHQETCPAYVETDAMIKLIDDTLGDTDEEEECEMFDFPGFTQPR